MKKNNSKHSIGCVLLCIALVIVQVNFAFSQAKKSTTKPSTESTKKATGKSDKKSEETTEEDPRSAHIKALAKSYGDSIVVRWAPDKPGAWTLANDVGYIIERSDVTDSTKLSHPYEKLTPSALKPWSKEKIVGAIKEPKENMYLAIAGQCLYGRVTVPKPDASGQIDGLRLASTELSNKFSFSLFAADNNIVAANALALRFVDKNVSKGRIYVYRVYSLNTDISYKIDTAYVVVDCTERIVDKAIEEVRIQEIDKRIRLAWDNLPKGAEYTGFHVWRKDLESGESKQLTTTPLTAMVQNSESQKIPVMFEDSTITRNYKEYEYTIRGITAFADYGEPATVKAMGRDRTPPPTPELKKPLILGKNIVRLEWTMPSVPEDIQGFYVARSSNPSVKFHLLNEKPIAKTQLYFLDTAATESEKYYIVGAIDTAGNINPALPVVADIIDSLPPVQPKGFKGYMDSTGVVHLSWQLGNDADLLGYRILWANSPDHEFSQREGNLIQDTVYNDSTKLNTGTPFIYYKLVAVDTRYMHSEPTPILSVRRYDTIPPETPLISEVFVTDSTIVLKYIQSRSADLKHSILQRREETQKEWKDIATIAKIDGQYTDRNVQKTKRYIYQMIAVDSIGNKSSPSPPVQGRPYDTGIRSAVSGVTAVYDSVTKQVRVRWQYPPAKTGDDHWFVVYRSYEGYDIRQYRAVDNKTFEFTDKNLHAAGTFHYAVRVFTPNGQSELSNVQHVLIK